MKVGRDTRAAARGPGADEFSRALEAAVEAEPSLFPIARRLLASGASRIALVAAEPGTELVVLLVGLGAALGRLAERPASVIPAWQRWGSVSRPHDDAPRSPGPWRRALGHGMTILCPRPVTHAAGAAAALADLLAGLDAEAGSVLLDLSGLEANLDVLVPPVDATALVTRAGVGRESALRALAARLPRFSGIILIE